MSSPQQLAVKSAIDKFLNELRHLGEESGNILFEHLLASRTYYRKDTTPFDTTMWSRKVSNLLDGGKFTECLKVLIGFLVGLGVPVQSEFTTHLEKITKSVTTDPLQTVMIIEKLIDHPSFRSAVVAAELTLLANGPVTLLVGARGKITMNGTVTFGSIFHGAAASGIGDPKLVYVSDGVYKLVSN